jgi:hypothetical protein
VSTRAIEPRILAMEFLRLFANSMKGAGSTWFSKSEDLVVNYCHPTPFESLGRLHSLNPADLMATCRSEAVEVSTVRTEPIDIFSGDLSQTIDRLSSHISPSAWAMASKLRESWPYSSVLITGMLPVGEGGFDWQVCVGDEDSGLSSRISRAYDVHNNAMLMRAEVRYGFTMPIVNNLVRMTPRDGLHAKRSRLQRQRERLKQPRWVA